MNKQKETNKIQLKTIDPNNCRYNLHSKTPASK